MFNHVQKYLSGILYVFSFWRVDIEPKEEVKPEIDEKFWELLMSSDKKDYDKICAQYAITDFRWMLKKLNEKKQERVQEQEKVLATKSYI